MKKITIFSITMTSVICLLWGCSKAQTVKTETTDMIKDKNVLIVYLSRTKNTKAIAEIIHENVGGTLVALELKQPYPEDYKTTVDQVARENETGFLPPLKTTIDGMEKYDVIFVGFPTWGMQLPPPLKSFLKQYNLSGKTLIPFNTNAGYGTGNSFQTIKELAPSSKISEGFSTLGSKEKDGIYFVMEAEKEKQAQVEIIKWLQKIRVLK